jgi:hypothetical protein
VRAIPRARAYELNGRWVVCLVLPDGSSIPLETEEAGALERDLAGAIADVKRWAEDEAI